MFQSNHPKRTVKPGGLEAKGHHLATAAILLGYALLLLAILVIEQSTARADGLYPECQIQQGAAGSFNGHLFTGCLDSPGSIPDRGKQPVQATAEGVQTERSGRLQSEAGFEAAWVARLTVGMATDGTTTIHGYATNSSPQVGDLSLDSFTYQGETFVINNLVVQQVSGGIIQLVLDMNRRLPDEWFFQAKSGEYALSDALELGSGLDIYAWRMNELPDWKEGETFQVALWREFGPQGQEAESIVGPDHVHTVPAGTGAAGTLNPGDTLQDEIENQGQFIAFKIIVEPGRRYRIDMKGAATGDGTLSDPWISGIKGAFETEHGVQMQPVWYDEQGRSSTDVIGPGGESYVLDQHGRYFTLRTGSDGEAVFWPPMGSNDDGGEGFNARLLLVNFPAREYVIVVSGSPNPSPVGTFIVSLTDVTEDDYSADDSDAGNLAVGCCATGSLEVPGDVDWFEVELEADTTYAIEVKGEPSADIILERPRVTGIFDSTGLLLMDGSLPGATETSYRQANAGFTTESEGTYFIGVAAAGPYTPTSSTLPIGTYTVSVTESESQ